MRRRKDDKRVLRAGNGRNNKRNLRAPNLGFKSRNNNSRRNRPVRPPNNRVKKQKKRSGKTVLLMVIILMAFVIGAGMGVLMSFDDGTDDSSNNETHVENVTKQMTSNLSNRTDYGYFDDADAVDFNENQTSELIGVNDNPYYNDDGLGH